MKSNPGPIARLRRHIKRLCISEFGADNIEERKEIFEAMAHVLETNEPMLKTPFVVLDLIDKKRLELEIAAQIRYGRDKHGIENWKTEWSFAHGYVKDLIWESIGEPTIEDWEAVQVAIDIDQTQGADKARAFLREHGPRHLARTCGACGSRPGAECIEGWGRYAGIEPIRRAVPHETRVMMP